MAWAVISGLLTGALEADLFKRLHFLGCTTAASMSLISFWAILAIFLASWTVRLTPRLRHPPSHQQYARPRRTKQDPREPNPGAERYRADRPGFAPPPSMPRMQSSRPR